MKKRILSLLILTAMLLSLFPSASLSANAASVNYVDRIKITVDVPVDGVALKTDVVVNAFADYMNAGYSQSYPATKLEGVAWYLKGSGTPLKSGYVAKLGETYTLSVILSPYSSQYAFRDNMSLYDNRINDKATTETKYSNYWAFSVEYSAVASVSGAPVVSIKRMELSPFEGEPMEVEVSATGTNLKYQWQICYGDKDEDGGGINWGSAVAIEDNQRYKGCQTPHFKIHTYFGDWFDEELSFCTIRCKVTSDSGTSYSQEFWYVLIDRTVLGSVALSGVTVPVSGELPSKSVSESAVEYSVGEVEWYRSNSNGTMTEMIENEPFAYGDYICRIYIVPEREYKFDSNTKVTVNGVSSTLNTISGFESDPYGPDEYYVDVRYKALPKNIDNVELSLSTPLVGEESGKAISETDGVSVVSTTWQKLINNQYYAMEQNETFKSGIFYRAAVSVKANEGYRFSDNTVFEISGEKISSFGSKNDSRAVLYITYYVADCPYVDVSYNKPLVTQTVENNNLFGSIIINSSYQNISVQSAKWYDVNGNEFTGTFEASGKYTVRMLLKCIDGKFENNTLFMMNGKEASAVTFYEDNSIAAVEYQYWLSSSYISIEELKAPIAYTTATEPEYTAIISDNNKKVGITAVWLDSNGNEFSGMFLPLQKYTAKFIFEGLDGAKVSQYQFIINGNNPSSSEVVASNAKAVYYDFYIASNTIIFTSDSAFEIGKTVTVDIEKMAELDDDIAEAYFNGDIRIEWYIDGKNVSTKASGDFGESLSFVSEDKDKEFYVVFKTGSKTLTSPDIRITGNASSEEFILGDVDNDGDIDADDYIVLKRLYFGTAKLEKYGTPESVIARSDLKVNGKIDADDYILLKRVYFGTYKIP